MTDRVARLYEIQKNRKTFHLTCEKANIMVNSMAKNAGWPTPLRFAMAEEEYAQKRSIYIADDELIVGNMAAKPNGIELNPNAAPWPREEFEEMLEGLKGIITVDEKEFDEMEKLEDYWVGHGRQFYEYRGLLIDDDDLFPFMRRGFIVPPYKNKFVGRGRGACGGGATIQMGNPLILPDYALHLSTGFEKYIEDAKKALKAVKYTQFEDADKAIFYQATIKTYTSAIVLANRYADLAAKMASECADPVRKKELEEISEICRQVPAKPARTFREALQAWYFYWMYMASGILGMGRMDQYLYPFYKADLDAGRITHDEAVELIECLRLKMMEYLAVAGGKLQRDKFSGNARWNNIILGGSDGMGHDQTNDLTYCFIDAAMEVTTPHPTMTVRVGDTTPKELMMAALKLVRKGCGFPAFISENQYMEYLQSRGIPREEASEFGISGCIDLNLPGRSRVASISMFVVPMLIELALNNGRNPKTGELLGVEAGRFEDCKTYEEFYDLLMEQTKYIMVKHTQAAFNTIAGNAKMGPLVFHSGFYRGTLEAGTDIFNRKMHFENGAAFNAVGMANAINSLAAVKKLCFDDKICTPAELNEALHANWEGHEDLRQACLNAPKYGNDIDYVDSIGEKFWIDLKDVVETQISPYGEKFICSAISITTHEPGGALTSATPDGRFDGETLADGSVSPTQGTDKNGVTAVFKSAMRMSKGWSVNLFNVKFTPSTLKTDADLEKLASLITVYMKSGGKQVQFNVADEKVLRDAQAHPENHRDLLVRVAGYSTYFVSLSNKIQDEVIERTTHVL